MNRKQRVIDKRLRPLAYYSVHFNATEQRRASVVWEAYAAACSVFKFRWLLLGAKFDFLLITDCRCLEQSNKSMRRRRAPRSTPRRRSSATASLRSRHRVLAAASPAVIGGDIRNSLTGICHGSIFSRHPEATAVPSIFETPGGTHRSGSVAAEAHVPPQRVM